MAHTVTSWQVSVRHCTLFTRNTTHPRSSLRFLYAAQQQQHLHTQSKSRKRRKNQHTTVLDALASTINDVPTLVRGSHHDMMDDALLSPWSKKADEEIIAAMGSGCNVANGVLGKNGTHLTKIKTLKDSMSAEEILMKNCEDVPLVVDWYKRKVCDGKATLDVSNAVLDFLSLHRNAKKSSHGAFADYVFASVKRSGGADAYTYESYILGLVNSQWYDMAFQVFREMTHVANINGSLHLHNMLLSHVCDAVEGDEERWTLALSLVKTMRAADIQPNTLTYTFLTQIASKRKHDAFAKWHGVVEDMKKLNMKPSLASHYYLFKNIVNVDCTPKTKDEQMAIAYGIIGELEEDRIDTQLHHEDDLLFLPAFMYRCTKIDVNVCLDLFDAVETQNLFHLVDDPTFYKGFMANVAKDYRFVLKSLKGSMGLSMHEVYTEFSRISKHCTMDDFNYDKMFKCILEARDPTYLVPLYNDHITKSPKHLTSSTCLTLLKCMTLPVAKTQHREYLPILLSAFDASLLHLEWTDIDQGKRTDIHTFLPSLSPTQRTDAMSVCLYILCSCGELEEVQTKLEQADDERICSAAIVNAFQLSFLAGDAGTTHSLWDCVERYHVQLSAEDLSCIAKGRMYSQQQQQAGRISNNGGRPDLYRLWYTDLKDRLVIALKDNWQISRTRKSRVYPFLQRRLKRLLKIMNLIYLEFFKK